MERPSLLILCYGEGGHHAQARRLHAQLIASSKPFPDHFICVTDKAGISLPGASEIVLRPLRRKDTGWPLIPLFVVLNLLANLRVLRGLAQAVVSSRTCLLISLGPAFSVLPAILVRSLRGTVVHIETWSRFRTRSATARVLAPVAHHFLVQNESLLDLYPQARYVGRL